MTVVIVDDGRQVAQRAAEFVAGLVERAPRSVLGEATGSSPLGLSGVLAENAQDGFDFSEVTGIALDEYLGLSADSPQSCSHIVRERIEGPFDMRPGAIQLPPTDPDAAGAYDALIAEHGGVDLQVLGIGVNGHIGFHEPPSSLASRTRRVELSASTRAASARFVGALKDVPHATVTQGIGTILAARSLLLVATGGHKASAVAAAIESPISSRVPGSALQLHSHATIVVDQEAASELTAATIRVDRRALS